YNAQLPRSSRSIPGSYQLRLVFQALPLKGIILVSVVLKSERSVMLALRIGNLVHYRFPVEDNELSGARVPHEHAYTEQAKLLRYLVPQFQRLILGDFNGFQDTVTAQAAH